MIRQGDCTPSSAPLFGVAVVSCFCCVMSSSRLQCQASLGRRHPATAAAIPPGALPLDAAFASQLCRGGNMASVRLACVKPCHTRPASDGSGNSRPPPSRASWPVPLSAGRTNQYPLLGTAWLHWRLLATHRWRLLHGVNGFPMRSSAQSVSVVLYCPCTCIP
jgi:hypothetical protein